jgi:hypothetical protein
MFHATKSTRANYYKYLARLNYEAAKAADAAIGDLPGYEVAAPPPVMTLCAHSIELSAKAVLLEKGWDEAKVRRLGHNLVECVEACKLVGADTSAIDGRVLEIISDLLVSGRLRYGDESKLGQVPVFGPLSSVCESCLDMCGAPKLSGLLA